MDRSSILEFSVEKGIPVMKFHRLLAVLMVTSLFFGLLAGCGTSQEVSESIMSVPESESWAELELPEASQPPETETVMPELDIDAVVEEDGEDVTDEYKNVVLGTWDNEKKTYTYEFKSNENLVITQKSSGASETYTYWFMDVSGQVRLYSYANGQEEATAYSFTISGSNMTLYDITTGNAVELLTRQAVVAATATPAPTAASAPTVPPTPTPSPSTEPSPSPSMELPQEPSPSVEPEPSPSPAVELPDYVTAALPTVECVLDVLLDGKAYDAADPEGFWNIMARYLSLSHESDDDEYITVSEGRVLNFAQQVFPNFTEITQIPACPEGSGLVEYLPGDNELENQYHILWGAAGGHEMEVLSYQDGTLLVQLDGVNTFGVVVNEDGTVASAGPVA